MKLFNTLGKLGFNLFLYFAKGAKIDAALEWNGRSRTQTGVTYPKPGASPIMENDKPIAWDADDMIRQWRVITKAKLVLKNNSKNYAYNVTLPNVQAIFDSCQALSKLTSLEPNGVLSLDVEFIQICHFHSGLEADELPAIPANKENKVLKIQYQNEAGTMFFTNFFVSFKAINNEHGTG